MSFKVLVADDDSGIRALLSKYFERQGYETVLAQDGLEAVETAKKTHPDLVILDVVMPRMDGFRTARLIKSYKPLSGIPIVFLTAKDAEKEIDLARQARAEVYITKPFDVHQVFLVVEELLSTAKHS